MDYDSPGERETSADDRSQIENFPDPSGEDWRPPIQKSPPPSPKGLWARAKHLIVHYVLQLDGSPHSIALGVFLGFLIGMTPTIGLQMLTYFAVCAVVGANRISGLLPVWISNPFTAVPLYYFNWRVGVAIMTGQLDGGSASKEELAALLAQAPGQDLSLWERMFSADFWRMAFELFVALGLELWVGCITVGTATGLVGYWAALAGVKAYRRHQTSAP
ncbi:MAG: DUF2062 domain-containing protein [Myxococcota bacterium]